MSMHSNNLREYRKRSPLNQSDIAHLLQLPDTTSVSRYEQGLRKPGQDIKWLYHMLFNMPLPNLLGKAEQSIAYTLKERVQGLIQELLAKSSSQNINKRVSFLDSVISRLG